MENSSASQGFAPRSRTTSGVGEDGEESNIFHPLEASAEAEFLSGEFSDVCFGVGPDEVRLFSCKAMLAIASPVFRAMFFSSHAYVEASKLPLSEPVNQLVTATCCNSSPLLVTGAEDGDNEESLLPRSLELNSKSNLQILLSSGSFSSTTASERGVFRPEQHAYVAVPDIEPEAMHSMLRYVHHMDPCLTLDKALFVLKAADKYQIDELQRACTKHLETADLSDVDLTLALLDASCRLGLEKQSQYFLQAVGDFSRLQTSGLLGCRNLLAVHESTLKRLLESSCFCVPEEPLWHAVRSWAEFHANGGTTSWQCWSPASACSGGSRGSLLRWEKPHDNLGSAGSTETVAHSPRRSWQDVLRPLQGLLRFPTMRSSFFAREVAKSGLLSDKEVVDIFCFLATRKNSTTPPGPEGTSSCQPLVSGKFCSHPRVPLLQWVFQGPLLVEDLISQQEYVEDLGSRIAMAPGQQFHPAFGSQGFQSGRHAWTITWRPLEGPPRGNRSSGLRGGAAGIAPKEELWPKNATTTSIMDGMSRSASASGNLLIQGPVATSPSAKPMLLTDKSAGVSFSRVGGNLSGVDNYRYPPSEQPADNCASRFLDWPSCIVFGAKKDIVEQRYVAWDPEVADTEHRVRFAISLDFVDRTITYLADKGERRWIAPLTHDGPVYPVVAASGRQEFHIQYGYHL